MDILEIFVVSTIVITAIIYVFISKIAEIKNISKRLDDEQKNNSVLKKQIQQLKQKNNSLSNNLDKANAKLQNKQNDLDEWLALEIKRKASLEKFLNENIKFYPFLAGAVADYITYDIEILAQKLDWGNSIERAKKVQSIREIRQDAKERIAAANVAIYQLEYLKALYPALEDVLDTNYNDLNFKNGIPESDPIRTYLTKEEWESLSDSEKNQRALDNYINSHRKSNWQIGRDYELYVGYKYSQMGYIVDYYGSYNGLDDLGRDIIARKTNKILIIQCKYWSKEKTIHEKHINQLYGTTVSYSIETNIPQQYISGVFVTSTILSDRAKLFAKRLGIKVKENFAFQEFPRIKCNIKNGNKIYHLPMDQQYDKVKIDHEGEFYAFTVEEAEKAGFRRAYKWHSNE